MSRRSSEKVTLSVEVRAESLASTLVDGMDRDALYNLIVAIDDAVAEMDFTERLRDRFLEVIKNEEVKS